MLIQIKRCFLAMIRGEEVPSESQEDKKFAHEVHYSEATTESVLQLIFACIILREYGLPLDPFKRYVQLSSLIGSIFAITVQFAKVKLFIFIIDKNAILIFISCPFSRDKPIWQTTSSMDSFPSKTLPPLPFG